MCMFGGGRASALVPVSAIWLAEMQLVDVHLLLSGGHTIVVNTTTIAGRGNHGTRKLVRMSKVSSLRLPICSVHGDRDAEMAGT